MRIAYWERHVSLLFHDIHKRGDRETPRTEVKIQPIETNCGYLPHHTYVEPFTVAWLVNKCSGTKGEEGLELRWVYHPMLRSTTCIRG